MLVMERWPSADQREYFWLSEGGGMCPLSMLVRGTIVIHAISLELIRYNGTSYRGGSGEAGALLEVITDEKSDIINVD